MNKQVITRKSALEIIAKQKKHVRDAIAIVVQTADVQTDWGYREEEGSFEFDDVQGTLDCLAEEIRGL